MPAHILVVEPDQDLTRVLWHFLTTEGYRVTVADSDSAGLAAARRGRFDLVLTDSFYRPLAAAGDTPWAWPDTLRDVAAGAPVILMTAYPLDLFAGRAAGVDTVVLSKPFSLAWLLAEVRRHLRAI